ncbi:hypothetical protein [Chryseobacterium sp. RLHN22]|uniref:hypothetical protein n=1 Tax=Chryseobacterium sp. RLHN22 TaxID=3437885 RepID=UPI003D9BA179
MIDTYFQFHPVGQGGFYSGHFGRERDAFNFVFDCGSLSIKTEFKNFVDNVKRGWIQNEKLNILFISHLDDDHVNGIKFLLKNSQCDNIYLPYLTPFERLVVITKHSESAVTDYNDFITFMVNPSNYLLGIDGAEIGSINYINGNSDEIFEERPADNPIIPDGFSSKLSDNLEVIPDHDLTDQMQTLKVKGKVVFKKANQKLIYGNFWEFFLYHIKQGNSKSAEFISKINEIYNLNVNIDLTQSDLETILQDKIRLKLLRNDFKTIFKNINKTGLIVQHKPINYSRLSIRKQNTFSPYYHKYRHYRRSLSNETYFIDRHNNQIFYCGGVSLLTGDIRFDDIDKASYIRGHLQHLSVLQVPHHGSSNGWNSTKLESFNNDNTDVIINFGFGNTYGHPRPNVLQDLYSAEFDVHFCNQFEEYCYLINLKL